MTGLALLLLAGLLLAVAIVTAMIVATLTRPPRRTYAWAVARGRPGDPGELPRPRAFGVRTFRSRGLVLPAWEVQGADPAGPAVICTHGWSESRLALLERLAPLAESSSRVIAWDLPGHGEAPGRCRLGTAEVDDLLALAGEVRDEEDAKPAGDGRPVVLAGWSLGAGVSIAAAARAAGGSSPSGVEIAGVIAEAPYRQPWTPARAVLGLMRVPRAVPLPLAMALLGVWFGAGPRWRGRRDRAGRAWPFDRAELAALVACPLLVIHGDADEICPLADGRAIAAAAPRGVLVEIAGGQHRDLWLRPETAGDCSRAVRDFLRGVRDAYGER